MKVGCFGCLLAMALWTSAPVLAHHSAAGVDRSKSVTITGTVKQFKWANPHSWMEIEVSNDRGGSDLWNVEMTSPSFLVRAGWKSTTVKPGDRVSIIVRPMKSGEPGGLFVSITLPSGQVLDERSPLPGQTPPAP